MKPKLIYIAGPYSHGDVAVNVARAMKLGMRINDLQENCYAVIPHLTHFLHISHPRPYKYWLQLDNLIIPHCSELIRIEGESSSADKENLPKVLASQPLTLNGLRTIMVWKIITIL